MSSNQNQDRYYKVALMRQTSTVTAVIAVGSSLKLISIKKDERSKAKLTRCTSINVEGTTITKYAIKVCYDNRVFSTCQCHHRVQYSRGATACLHKLAAIRPSLYSSVPKTLRQSTKGDERTQFSRWTNRVAAVFVRA